MATHDSIFRHIRDQLAMMRAVEAFQKDLLGAHDALTRAVPKIDLPSFAQLNV